MLEKFIRICFVLYLRLFYFLFSFSIQITTLPIQFSHELFIKCITFSFVCSCNEISLCFAPLSGKQFCWLLLLRWTQTIALGAMSPCKRLVLAVVQQAYCKFIDNDSESQEVDGNVTKEDYCLSPENLPYILRFHFCFVSDLFQANMLPLL